KILEYGEKTRAAKAKEDGNEIGGGAREMNRERDSIKNEKITRAAEILFKEMAGRAVGNANNKEDDDKNEVRPAKRMRRALKTGEHGGKDQDVEPIGVTVGELMGNRRQN
ncbi:hypothetical protein LTR28_010412, partial [Elasticomyces elasticus]